MNHSHVPRPNASISAFHEVKSADHVVFYSYPLNHANNPPPSFELYKPDQQYHFYCSTLDLTRPYPSQHKVSDYSADFCWNRRWRQPFEEIGCPDACVVLLQGYIGTLLNESDPIHTITYIARRSVLNPGTRYFARGLNELGSPGNEVECELIIINSPTFSYESFIWRRGTIPIIWRTENTAIPIISTHMTGEQSFESSQNYFIGLVKRLQINEIIIVSLLQGTESMIEGPYEAIIRAISLNKHVKIHFLSHDLNATLQQSPPIIQEVMSTFFKDIVAHSGYNCGEIGYKPTDESNKQKCLFRVNCMDSVDRTNIATFFLAYVFIMSRGLPISWKEHLAKLFLDSGDVLSRLYLGTSAVKTQILTLFAGLPSRTHFQDMKKSVNRRFASDERHNIILKWTKVFSPNPRPLAIIPPTHLTILCADDAEKVIFERKPTFAEYLGKSTIFCRLPQPLSIDSIFMMVLPHQNFNFSLYVSDTLSCSNWISLLSKITLPEVNLPTLCKFSLVSFSKMGLDSPNPIAYNPFRFLIFSFDTDYSKSYKVGNIFIQSSLILHEKIISIPSYPISPQLPENENFQDYQKLISSISQFQDVGLRTLTSLEIMRIEKGISIEKMNHLFLTYRLSPWFFIPTARINYRPLDNTNQQNPTESTSSICPICKGPLGNSIRGYHPDDMFPSIFYPVSYEFNEESTHKVTCVCQNCQQQINSLKDSIIQLKEAKMIRHERIPFVFNPPKWSFSEISPNSDVEISKWPYSFFALVPSNCTGNPNSILTSDESSSDAYHQFLSNNERLIEGENGITILNNPDEKTPFILSLMSEAAITLFMFDKDFSCDLEILPPQTKNNILNSKSTPQKSIVLEKQGNNIFKVLTPFLTNTLSFRLHILDPSIEKVKVLKMKVFGKIVPPSSLQKIATSYDKIFIPKMNKKLKDMTLSNLASSGYHPETQMHIFQLKEPKTPIKIIFSVRGTSNKFNSPSSVLVSLYENENLKKYYHFIIPIICNDRIISFTLTNSVRTQTIRVLYLDRVPNLCPLNISFHFLEK